MNSVSNKRYIVVFYKTCSKATPHVALTSAAQILDAYFHEIFLDNILFKNE